MHIINMIPKGRSSLAGSLQCLGRERIKVTSLTSNFVSSLGKDSKTGKATVKLSNVDDSRYCNLTPVKQENTWAKTVMLSQQC